MSSSDLSECTRNTWTCTTRKAGSASAILAGPLLASGVLSRGENRIALRQGIEMGRPSRIGLTAIVRDGALTEIRISGRAAKVAEGRITIPEVE